MTAETFYSLLSRIGDVASYAGLAPLLFLLFRRDRTSPYKMTLVIILLASILCDALSIYLSRMSVNNLFMTHIWAFIELPLWASFFIALFRKSALIKRVLITATITGMLFTLADTVFFESILTFNTYGRTAVAVITICFCLLYFFCYPESDNNYGFWITAALLVYNGSNVLLFIFSNNLLKQQALVNHVIWAFHSLLLIGLYTAILADGLSWKKKQTSPQLM
ncbi:hypothetical protein [Pedobacter nutrimenti]|uniref:hypothetical protein n=1 Tax=Pedobacter nutrimenti TaxID=1241337 RepID=UPI0029307F5D|nr:hypothetical protein [Pedobacter nutrimenti]